jgi:tetratricopeptide (TPR) repeat protein
MYQKIDLLPFSSPIRLFSTLLCLVAAVGCSTSQDFVERGNKALAGRKFSEALLNYQRAIQKDPQSAEAFRKLGITQEMTGNFIEAVGNLERALQLAPNNDALRGELADAALSLYLADPRRPKGRYEQVSKLSQELLAKNARSFDGLRFRASLLYSDGHVAEAIEAFRKANDVKPMEPEVILPLADALRKNGQVQEAEHLGLELIARHKDYLPMYDWLHSFYQDTNRPEQAEAILIQKVAGNPKDSLSILQLAAQYYRSKKPKEMTAALNQLLERPKDFPNRFLLVGDFYLGVRNWDEAIRWFDAGVESDPRQARIYRKRVVAVYLAEQKRKEALELLSRLLQEAPNDWDMRAERVEIFLAGQDKQEILKAVSESQELVKANPTNGRMQYLLGRAHLARGDKDLAAQAFAQAAARNRFYLEPRIALANLDRQMSKYAETVRLADEILEIDRNNFSGKLLHASGSRGLGNLDAAQRELQALIKDAPQSRDLELEMGLLALAHKQYAAAERVFNELYRSGQSDMRALAALTATYLEEKQFDRAFQTLNGELNRSPDSVELRELLANTALRAGKTDLALEQYQKLTQMAPGTARYFVSVAEIFRVKRDYPHEIAALEKARQLTPGDAIVAGRLAVAKDAMGHKQEAAPDYKKALAMAPSDPALLNNQAYFLAEGGGNLDEALAYSQAALRKLPNNPAVLDTLAWIYTKRQMNDSAIQILDKLVHQNPDVAAFHYHLGLALAQKGEREKAKAELSLALTKTPTPEDATKIRDLIQKL